ncbi:MAG: helix-turn-helix domain-containing protein [bacterium]
MVDQGETLKDAATDAGGGAGDPASDASSVETSGPDYSAGIQSPAYDGDFWLDIRESAKRLGTSEKTVRRYIKSGRLRARKISGVWFVGFGKTAPAADAPETATAPGLVPEPAMDERLGRIEEKIGGIIEQIKEMNKKLYVLSEEREHIIAAKSLDLLKKEEIIERLEEENRRLIDEVGAMREEAGQLRQSAPKDVQALKNKTDEILSLKATIASNERGLALLREEAALKDRAMREKNREIAELRDVVERLRPLMKGRAKISADVPEKNGGLETP